MAGADPILWAGLTGGIASGKSIVAGFFEEHNLQFERTPAGPLDRYTATQHTLTLYCGDYFDFQTRPFDALYDRGALVAFSEDERPRYVEHTNGLLKPDAIRLVITLEYDQRVVNGPPYAVPADKLVAYWDDLIRVGEKDDIDTCPPKFRQAGLTDIAEVFWLSH